MENEVKEIVAKVEDIQLECNEIVENYSDVSSNEDFDLWRNEICEDGRYKYLSVNMDKDQFMYKFYTAFPEDWVYLPDDIHMHGYYYEYYLDGKNRRIHLNGGCMELFEAWYAMGKEKLSASHYCQMFFDPQMMVSHVVKYRDNFFCDMCNKFLMEYDLFQYNPCSDCMDEWQFFNSGL